jgi:predicted Zn-dependent protease
MAAQHNQGMEVRMRFRSCIVGVAAAMGLAAGSALAQSVVPQTAMSGLPELGDGADMSTAAERRLGDRIAKSLYRDPDYIDDPVTMEYVQAIWQRLLVAARQRADIAPTLDEAFAWEILLGKDRSVNAFALPGGYLGLHLGLLAVVSSPDELASVLAHELTHVTQRHIPRGMGRQAAQAPWLIGAMVLGVLAASKDPNAANAAIVGGQAAAAQNQLNFSRDMEREADRIGLGVMTHAGFSPQGFVSMFEKLQESNRFNDSGGFAYLRSHPLTTERIADMQLRVPRTGPTATPLPTPMDHALVAARARVLSNPGVDALRQWATELQSGQWANQSAAAQAAGLYGAIFAAMKLRDDGRSADWLAQLLQRTANEPAAQRVARLLGAERALARGDLAQAAQFLQGLQSSGRAALLLVAELDVRSGRSDAAAQALQTWLVDHPRDAAAWQWLARANSALGRAVAAVRCEAEVNVAQLDYASAASRLRAAQDLARQAAHADPIETAVVQTRLRQVELALREQALER